MDALKIIGALLTYPSPELLEALPDFCATLDRERGLSARARAGLMRLMEDMAVVDPLEAQENYVGLFDRVRSLSLHLFEHVHGDSRDRGTAMVDLLSLYRQHGLELASNELPDFLPAFLEFLSGRPEAEARAMLKDVAHILTAIHGRLAARKSPYAATFAALLEFSGADLDDLPGAIEEPPEDIDREWAEAPVTFGPDVTAGCAKAEDMVKRMNAR